MIENIQPKRLAMAAFAAVFAMSCSASAEGTFVVGKAADPANLDPAITMSNYEWTVNFQAYERLIRPGVDGQVTTSELIGELASSWTTSDDGLTWTFEIAPGHFFSDGSEVTPAAIKFSFDRMLTIASGPSSFFDSIDTIEVVEPASVRITLKAPYPPFIAAMATVPSAIVSPAVMEHEVDGDMGQAWLAENTLGSGPYMLTEWDRGQQIVLEENPHYSGTSPFFDQIVFKIIPETASRRLQLEKGEIDLAEDLPLDVLEGLQSDEGVRVIETPSFGVTYLYVNNQRPPLDNPMVREALSYAIDTQSIVDNIYRGHGTRMRGPIPQGMWGYDPDAPQPEHSVEKAMALLREAGVAEGTELNFLYSTNDPNYELIALTVQANLAEVGLDVTLTNLVNATMREKVDTGDFDLAPGNWFPDITDPFMFYNYWFDSAKHGLAGNRSFYTNAEVDELIRLGLNSNSQADRERYYGEAQDILNVEFPYVYIVQKNDLIAVRDDINGLVLNPSVPYVYNFSDLSR